MLGATFRGRTSIATTGSTTIVAVDGSYRHHLTKGLITIATVTGAAIGGIYETNSTGSDSAVFVGLFNASSKTAFDFDFGDEGLACSATGSRLVLVQSGASSTINLHYVGYTR